MEENIKIYQQLFHEIDADGSGAIDNDELLVALQGIGITLTAP